MTEVLLGQSYYLRFDPKPWKAMQPYPPLGALFAASYLREKGHSVALFDAMLAESPEEWDLALQEHKPTFAVLFEDSFNYLSKMCLLRMRHAAFEMMASAKSAGCEVIVAGSDATDNPEEYLSRGADYVIFGEGETTLGELITSLCGRVGKSPDEIEGVIGQGPDQVPRRNLIRNLDSMPMPAWDLVDLNRYRQIWEHRHGYFSLNMVTTRGCPYHCNWCAKPIWGHKYHSRSPESVVEELEYLKRLANPDHIWFADDIFGLQKGWIERFSALVCERNLQTPFKCLLRTDLVTPERAVELRKAGCRTVWMGAESGSQRVLDAMEKGTTVQNTYEATRLLKEEGIEVAFFIQFGYPGEEWEDIRQTLRMVWDNMPEDVGVSVTYPLPGTKLHDRVRSELGANRNWVDSNDLAMLFEGRFSSQFYRQLHRTFHIEYRARKALRCLFRGELRSLAALVRSFTLPFAWFRLYLMSRS